MKSIIYLSDHGDRPCRAFVIEHEPGHLAFDAFKRDHRWTSPRLAHLSYTCTIGSSLTIHEKINHRAEYISRTASHHGVTHRREWGGPPWGRDYRFPTTEQRVARSRIRKSRRLFRQCVKRNPHTPPRHLREVYTITPRDWLRWLRFRRKVIAIAKQGFGPLDAYFSRCKKDRRVSTSGFSRTGGHSSTSSVSLDLFEWASFTRRSHEYLGVSISLSCELRNSDFRTIAEASYG
jgi:hypothetical protein